MKKIHSIFFIILIVCVVASCRKPKQYSEIPALEYKSLEFTVDSSGFETFTMNLTFTDGDGDVGYLPSNYPEVTSPYYSNLVIKLLRMHNGVWTDTIEWCKDNQILTDVFPIQTRIPYLTPSGKNKSLKGDINKTEDLPACMLDTVKFTAFLYDRALHQSNTVESPVYFIDTQ